MLFKKPQSDKVVLVSWFVLDGVFQRNIYLFIFWKILSYKLKGH